MRITPQHKSTSINKFIFSILVVLLFSGCNEHRLAPVVERDATGEKAVSSSERYSAVDAKISQYPVKAGDTLYSIAFRFGVDFRTLANANNIGSDYLISIGQKLDIDKARNFDLSDNVSLPNPQSNPQSNPTVASTSTGTNNQVSIANRGVISTERVSKPITSARANKPTTNRATTRINKPKVQAPKPVKVSKPKVTTQAKLSNQKIKYWIWPNMGKLGKTFYAAGSKGINIIGNIGDPVRASASGRVVYAGSGLRGYGRLIIIKHNSDFISAYAHNKSIMVKENEIVKAGQKIAEIGNSGTDLPKLHFEIRYKGKPTNPLKYLPKR